MISFIMSLMMNGALAQTNCSVPLSVQPIADFTAHKDFQVGDMRLWISNTANNCGTLNFYLQDRGGLPIDEINIDGAGGLFYYTPKTLGTFKIIACVKQYRSSGVQTACEDFTVKVIDSTMTYPLFRDYPTDNPIVIKGRAYGSNFVRYTLQYFYNSSPSVLYDISNSSIPVVQTGTLGTLDRTSIPDGSRITLRLTFYWSDGTTSVINNYIIPDSNSWFKRIGPLTHSPAVADVDDDGKDEVFSFTHFGELYRHNIDGTEIFKTTNYGAAYSSPSVADLDSDRIPDVVACTDRNLYVFNSATGVIKSQFAIPSAYLCRVIPTLADLDKDGKPEVIIPLKSFSGPSQLLVLKYQATTMLQSFSVPMSAGNIYASASVADTDKDGFLEIVIAEATKVMVYEHNGVLKWEQTLVAPITGCQVNGAGSFGGCSKAALADLDADGFLEIVVSDSIFKADGSRFPGWSSPKSGTRRTVSTAIGDIDKNGTLEVVIGNSIYNANGTLNKRLSKPMNSAILANCGAIGHNEQDVFANNTNFLDGIVEGIHPVSGLNVQRWPHQLFGPGGDSMAPVFSGDADMDGFNDTFVQITDATYGGILAFYKMPSPARPEENEWPMMGVNVRQTGLYSKQPPNRSNSLSVVNSSTNVFRFTWSDDSLENTNFILEYSFSGAPFTWNRLYTTTGTSAAVGYSGTRAVYFRVKARSVDFDGSELLSKPSPVVRIR